ncbi:hypothetical protein HDU96_009023 [Phlyctochytrium bullatum]|nr:hypothetical protein HDU96_009023 [Phlyctochytrium bullatum]
MGGSAIVTVTGFVSAPVRKSNKVNARDFYLLINNFNIVTNAFCEAIWFFCTCWGSDLDPVLNLLQEGSGVSVTGEIDDLVKVTTTDGTRRTVHCIKMRVVTVVPLPGYVGGLSFHRSNLLKPQRLYESTSDATSPPAPLLTPLPPTAPLTSAVVTLIGRVTAPPTHHTVTGGTHISYREFQLLVNNYRQPGRGQSSRDKFADALWFWCVCIGTSFDNKLQYFDTEAEVAVVGEIDDVGHFPVSSNGKYTKDCIQVKVTSLRFLPSHRCISKFRSDNRGYTVKGNFTSSSIGPLENSGMIVKPDPEDVPVSAANPAFLWHYIKADCIKTEDAGIKPDPDPTPAAAAPVVKEEPTDEPAPDPIVSIKTEEPADPSAEPAVKTEEPATTTKKSRKRKAATDATPAAAAPAATRAKSKKGRPAKALSTPPVTRKRKTRRVGDDS